MFFSPHLYFLILGGMEIHCYTHFGDGGWGALNVQRMSESSVHVERKFVRGQVARGIF